MRRAMSRMMVGAAAGLMAAGAMAAGGCASYVSHPTPTSTLGGEDANAGQAVRTTTKALRWAVGLYQPSGEFAVNMPEGLSRGKADSIVAKLGPNARVLTPSTSDLPTFFVGRIWIRNDRAKIDIQRPIEVTGGSVIYEPITVWLEGGIRPWHVVRHQVWAVGSVELPAANVYEDVVVEEFAEVDEGAQPSDP